MDWIPKYHEWSIERLIREQHRYINQEDYASGTVAWECENALRDEIIARGYSWDDVLSYKCGNPDCCRQKNKHLRNKHKISPKLRFTVFSKASFSCTYCGRKPPDIELTVDHVVPISKGGQTVETNLVAACFECNIGKGAR